MQHDTDLRARDFHIWHKTNETLQNREAFGPENVWTSWIRVCSTETRTAISGREAQSCVVISKTRTRWQNHSLRGQLFRWRSRKIQRDYWLRLVSTPWDLDPHFRVWQLWAWEMRSSKQWYEEVKLDHPWSKNMNLGIPLKVDIQSDSSTANSLTDRLGAGFRTKHIDTRFFGEFKMEISVSRKFFQRKLCRYWTEANLCFSATTTLQIYKIDILLTLNPTLHHNVMGHGCAAHVNVQ